MFAQHTTKSSEGLTSMTEIPDFLKSIAGSLEKIAINLEGINGSLEDIHDFLSNLNECVDSWDDGDGHHITAMNLAVVPYQWDDQPQGDEQGDGE